MPIPEPDTRSEKRKRLDDEVAAEAELPPLNLPADAAPRPLEEHLHAAGKRPIALMGVVENGLVRLLDPDVKLPEHARVIVVTSHSV